MQVNASWLTQAAPWGYPQKNKGKGTQFRQSSGFSPDSAPGSLHKRHTGFLLKFHMLFTSIYCKLYFFFLQKVKILLKIFQNIIFYAPQKKHKCNCHHRKHKTAGNGIHAEGMKQKTKVTSARRIIRLRRRKHLFSNEVNGLF